MQDVLLDALCVYKYTAIAVFSVCPEKQHGVGCVAPKVCSPTQKAVFCYTALAVFSVCPEKQHGVGCVAPKVCSPTQKAVFCYTAKDVIVKITCVDKKLRACYDKAHRN